MITIITEALKQRDYSVDASAISKVADFIRRVILQNDTYKFTGSFTSGSHEAPVPASLMALVLLILYGTKLNDHQGKDSQASSMFDNFTNYYAYC